MPVRVGITGFGAIGRRILRAGLGRDGFEVVAINGTAAPQALAHLLKYDSNYGVLAQPVKAHDKALEIAGRIIPVVSERDPGKLPWADLGVDVVLECTGKFRDAESVSLHLRQGAKKVIIAAPAKGEDLTIVLGVNDDAYDPRRHDILSNASCTTNCTAPVMKVLHEAFGVENAMMSTIHSYTGDQNLLDATHKDLRRARAAAMNIVPTSTGVTKAIGNVLPALKGRVNGLAFRVPTPVVSAIDVTAVLQRPPGDAAAVNHAFEQAAAGPLRGILDVSDEPLVSSDLKQSPYSAIVDGLLTAVHGNLCKVVAWYDNEWGYAVRMVDLALFVGARLS